MTRPPLEPRAGGVPAVLGGSPLFEAPLPVGQLYFPSWEEYGAAFQGIFERQYYTNQGPLANQFERRLEELLGVKHAVCVTNATIGLSMVAEALDLRGTVAMPAFTFMATAQAMAWSGLDVRFCEVDPATHQMSLDGIQRAVDAGVCAILPVNMWGGSLDTEAVDRICRPRGVPVFYDSAHAIGASRNGRPVGGEGVAEVFSFHATKVLGAAEGGCITTDDDELAERLRNVRSSYGVRRTVPVRRTANGRMSEAQAAIGLMNLGHLDEYIARNLVLRRLYQSGLAGIAGLKVCEVANVGKTNWQYLICEIDAAAFGLGRDQLMAALHADNIHARRYFSPGIHRCVPFSQQPLAEPLPLTDALCEVVIQLPLGARVTERAATAICERVRALAARAGEVQVALQEK